MSVRMRHTRGHSGNRRSHHALTEARISKCEKCGFEHLRHRVCGTCGNYRGKEMINSAKALEKKVEKLQKSKEKAEAES